MLLISILTESPPPSSHALPPPSSGPSASCLRAASSRSLACAASSHLCNSTDALSSEQTIAACAVRQGQVDADQDATHGVIGAALQLLECGAGTFIFAALAYCVPDKSAEEDVEHAGSGFVAR